MNKSKEAFLPVDEHHELYYQQLGNPAGIPVLFIHGGPGGSFTEKDKTFFDPEKFNVVLFEQRGSGRSRSPVPLLHNNTWTLVEDVHKLANHLQLEKPILFGGSWGSTLALLYAISYPEKTRGLILRGVFTASKKERKFFEQGGVASFFPEVWERFASKAPVEEKQQVSDFYYKTILSSKDEVQREQLSYELIRYGFSIYARTNNDIEIDKALADTNHVRKAQILAHYSINNFFLPDQFILNNLNNISNLPIYIVQGRYDMITTPEVAYTLCQKLKNAKLYMVDAGHSPHEDKAKSQLIACLDELGEL